MSLSGRHCWAAKQICAAIGHRHNLSQISEAHSSVLTAARGHLLGRQQESEIANSARLLLQARSHIVTAFFGAGRGCLCRIANISMRKAAQSTRSLNCSILTHWSRHIAGPMWHA